MAAARGCLSAGGGGRPSGPAGWRDPPGQQPRPRSAAAVLLAREEEYKRVNAELEGKAAAALREAEAALKDKQETLSGQVELFDEEGKPQRDLHSPELHTLSPALNKQPYKKKSNAVSISRSRPLTGRKGKKPLLSAKSRVQDVAAPSNSLARIIGKIEGQLEEGALPDLEDNLIPSPGSGLGAEAQIRFLKAKLRVMQEELDAMGQECSRKEDDNGTLSSRLKEAEEECGRLQRTAGLQQSQVEKYRTLSEEAGRKSEGLQQKLSLLEKELETLKRAQKQALANQSTTDIRLNRALEEAEKYKVELNKLKQSNKDVVNQEHKKLEELKIENKRLEKQKDELMTGFKKQLKLIDILKRQKMHIESAKMLSFTEEEFLRALEWGNV